MSVVGLRLWAVPVFKKGFYKYKRCSRSKVFINIKDHQSALSQLGASAIGRTDDREIQIEKKKKI